MGGGKTLSASDITRLIRLKTNNMLYKADILTSSPATARMSGVSFSPFGNLASGDCILIQNTFGVCKTSVDAPILASGQVLDGNGIDGLNLLILDGDGNNPEFILDGN